MLGPGVGLAELVQAQVEDLRRLRVHETNLEVDYPRAAEEWEAILKHYADRVEALCRSDHCLLASRVRFKDYPFPTAAEEAWLPNYCLIVAEQTLEWKAFVEVLEFMDRIDSFLAVLECRNPLAALARDCRRELDLLCVLADWCADAGLPHAAAEARRLHALACSYFRS